MGTKTVATRYDDTDALIAAAGAGTRLGLGPKLFVTVGGRSLLAHTVASVHAVVSRVYVAVPPDCVEQARARLEAFPGTTVLPGGATRIASYRRAFQCARGDYLVIRDVARPFASPALVAATVRTAHASKAAAACVASDVPIARVCNGVLRESFDRDEVVIPTNPQCYHRSVMEAIFHGGATGRNEQAVTLWEACLLLGVPVSPVPGERQNVKITSPQDLTFARYLFESGT